MTAFADTTAAGGGLWSYGTTAGGTQVYSNYLHPLRYHHSSTVNYWGESSCHEATRTHWSRDSQRADPAAGHTDNAYWGLDHCGS
ncbi:lactococcin 972 family bacteriocin [Acidipropionibacterium timonense]|uniref:lactococcin 972 family bacteriocin n=1 Tax=Acidipropionibacterium timonense TaxID=2161818 RepID=UPI00398C69A0